MAYVYDAKNAHYAGFHKPRESNTIADEAPNGAAYSATQGRRAAGDVDRLHSAHGANHGPTLRHAAGR